MGRTGHKIAPPRPGAQARVPAPGVRMRSKASDIQVGITRCPRVGGFMRLLRIFLTGLALAAVAGAQTSAATVVGRVTDATGAVVPGVAIKVTNVATNIAQQGSSNEVGDFTIPYLNPGRYVLEASAAGFHTYKHAEFEL